MTLNGVMAVALRYFTQFGKPVFQHIGLTASICGEIYALVGATENAGLKNAGLENAAPDCRGGKRGSSTVWKAEVSVI